MRFQTVFSNGYDKEAVKIWIQELNHVLNKAEAASKDINLAKIYSFIGRYNSNLISTRFLGYDKNEVDRYVENLINKINDRQREIKELLEGNGYDTSFSQKTLDNPYSIDKNLSIKNLRFALKLVSLGLVFCVLIIFAYNRLLFPKISNNSSMSSQLDQTNNNQEKEEIDESSISQGIDSYSENYLFTTTTTLPASNSNIDTTETDVSDNMEEELDKNVEFSSANMVNGGLATYDNKYNYLSEESLVKLNIETGNKKTLLYEKVYYLNNDIDYLYFTKSSDGKIYRMKKDGSDLELLCEYASHELTLYNDILYFCSDLDNGNYHICSMEKDGSDLRIISDGNEWYMTLYNNMIFYTDYDNDRKLMRMNLDGTNQSILCEDACYDICIVNDQIYVSIGESRKMYCMSLTGENRNLIINSFTRYTNHDNSRIYYVNDNNDIYSCAFDGSDNIQMYNYDSFSFLNFANNKLYYFDVDNNSLLEIE